VNCDDFDSDFVFDFLSYLRLDELNATMVQVPMPSLPKTVDPQQFCHPSRFPGDAGPRPNHFENATADHPFLPYGPQTNLYLHGQTPHRAANASHHHGREKMGHEY